MFEGNFGRGEVPPRTVMPEEEEELLRTQPKRIKNELLSAMLN